MSLKVIATKRIYNERQDQIRFRDVLAKVLIDYTKTKKFPTELVTIDY